MLNRALAYSVMALVLVVASACKVDVPSNITVTTSNGLSCSATVSSAVAATSGKPVPVLVKVTGGTAPYSLPGILGTFDSFTNFTRTYSNSTSANIVVNDQVTVTDANGANTTCNFQVTVQSQTSSPSTLACTLTGTPSSIYVGNSVTLNATATGGTGALTFSGFSAGSNAVVSTPFSQTGASQGRAVVSYSQVGLPSASVNVTDQAGNAATCSAVTTVSNPPSVKLVATPSANATAGSSITLVATPSNFTGTPTYSFSSSSSGVVVSQTVSGSASATAVSSDFNAHTATITVTATSGTQTATDTTTVTFSSAPQLNCAITPAAGAYAVGDSVTFTVAATGSRAGETLIVDDMSATNATILTSPLSTTDVLRFSASGTQTVSVHAHSASGQSCNSGAAVSTTISIGSVLSSCSVYTDWNPVWAGSYFSAYAVPNTTNNGNVVIQSISLSPYTPNGGFNVHSWDPLSADVVIYDSGVYNLYVTLKDNSNNRTTTCYTQQIVY